jgi:sulfur carrier protein
VSHASQDAPSLLSIHVNGEARQLRAGSSVADLVEVLGLTGRKLAVAVNRDVVPRARHATQPLSHGDRIEILEAVGGG